MWDLIDIGDTTKGVILGGAITLLGTVVTQLFVGWQQAKQFDREAAEEREVMKLRHEREDKIADRSQREWVTQQIWGQRVTAYDRTLKLLSQAEAGFQQAMDHALNPSGEESIEKRRSGLEQAQAAMDELSNVNIYVNDRTLRLLKEWREDLIQKSQATQAKDLVTRDQMLGAEGVAGTRKVIEKVRVEGREHLGDKLKSIQNVAEDALKVSQGQ